jgi:ribonuclease M5
MKELLHTARAVVVEGKYDAARLAGITDAPVFTTDGFAIYSDPARQALLRRLGRAQGILLLTDSDAAGFRIRTYLTNLIGAAYIAQAYIPARAGKEPRKAEPGREGLLGVEGIDDDTLRRVLADALRGDAGIPAAAPAANAHAPAAPAGTAVTASAEKPPFAAAPRRVCYTDLYEWGFSGTPGASERRAAFLGRLGLPPRLSKKELVEVLNRLYTYEELCEIQKAMQENS